MDFFPEFLSFLHSVFDPFLSFNSQHSAHCPPFESFIIYHIWIQSFSSTLALSRHNAPEVGHRYPSFSLWLVPLLRVPAPSVSSLKTTLIATATMLNTNFWKT